MTMRKCWLDDDWADRVAVLCRHIEIIRDRYGMNPDGVAGEVMQGLKDRLKARLDQIDDAYFTTL